MTSEQEPGRDEWRPWDQRADDTVTPPEQPGNETREEPLWARLGGEAPASDSGRAVTQPVPTQPAATAATPLPPAHPQPSVTGTGPAYGGYAVGTAAAPTAPEPTRGRRGPGWGALVGVAVAVALVAGTVGGILGGIVADRGTTGTSPPTPDRDRVPVPGRRPARTGPSPTSRRRPRRVS